MMLSFALSVALSAVTCGLSIALARMFGITDIPNGIKIHAGPMPRFGGFGIAIATLMTSLLAAILGQPAVGRYALIGLGLCALTGGIDDKFGLRPIHKLLGVAAGGVVAQFSLAWGVYGWSPLAAGCVALLVVLMTNAINLIDGMNGLAGGVTAVTSLFLSLLLHYLGDLSGATLAMTLAGACLGFLPWNFPQARTFMGDAGSLFIGGALALLVGRAALTGGIGALLGALTMCSLPLLDVACAVVRRATTGVPWWQGDRNHTYDRLAIKTGLSRTAVVLCMVGLTGVLGLTGMLFVVVTAAWLLPLVALGVVIAMGCYAWLYLK